jgi:hypothetical protein
MVQDRQFQLFKVDERKLVPQIEEIKIFHDERYSDDHSPFGHQFIVIPTRSEELINELLNQERKKFNSSSRTINWKCLRKKDWESTNTARSWNDLLPSMMAMKPFRGVSKGGKIIYKNYPLGVKIFSLFISSRSRMSDDFWMHISEASERNNRKYETLMRMAVKGGLKFLFNPEYTPYQKVKVVGFYTDGEVFGHRGINAQRVLGRVQEEAPEYLEIPNDLESVSIEKSKNKTLEVNFEELTDLVLGSTCYICGEDKQVWRNTITNSLKEVYDKRIRGVGIQRSRHFRAFSVSICDIVNDDFVFNDWWSTEEEDRKQFSIEFSS